MNHRKMGWALSLALVLLAAAAVAMAGHSKHANVHWADEGDVEKFDLSELEDGETRYFGSGEHEVRATREGDRVVVAFDEGDRPRELVCTIGDESCYVMVTDGEGKVLILRSASGDGSESLMLFNHSAGDGGQVFFGEGGEDGHGSHVRVHVGDGGHWVSSGEGHALIEVQAFGGGMVLRCPKGDTTMRLDSQEAEDAEASGGYYCPKHDLKLEPAPKLHRHGKDKVLVVVGEDDDR